MTALEFALLIMLVEQHKETLRIKRRIEEVMRLG